VSFEFWLNPGLIVGFSPLIDDVLGTSKVIEKSYTAALGAATTLFSIMLEDIS